MVLGPRTIKKEKKVSFSADTNFMSKNKVKKSKRNVNNNKNVSKNDKPTRFLAYEDIPLPPVYPNGSIETLAHPDYVRRVIQARGKRILYNIDQNGFAPDNIRYTKFGPEPIGLVDYHEGYYNVQRASKSIEICEKQLLKTIKELDHNDLAGFDAILSNAYDVLRESSQIIANGLKLMETGSQRLIAKDIDNLYVI